MNDGPQPSDSSNITPDTAQDVAERILEAIVNGPAEQYMSPEMQARFSLRGA